MKEITNLSTRALPLEDGTILAAAGTAGCVKQVESLSDDDARRLGGMIFVREDEVDPAPKTRVLIADNPPATARPEK